MITFWNGNKSTVRQDYEFEVLETVLQATEDEFGEWDIENDLTDYARAEDEGNVFNTGADILVTVAGNLKFSNMDKIVIPKALCKGLLGYRLLVVNDDDLNKFSQITSASRLQSLTIGIPATWADAELFRHNGYKVLEKGSFEEAFNNLKNKHFDYFALGANEIEDIYASMLKSIGGLSIEPTILLYYPFPTVFYVNPKQKKLAERITTGMDKITVNGELDKLFYHYNGDIVERLNLKGRKVFKLNNPILPAEMKGFSSDFLKS